jgi:hypothetical protein
MPWEDPRTARRPRKAVYRSDPEGGPTLRDPGRESDMQLHRAGTQPLLAPEYSARVPMSRWNDMLACAAILALCLIVGLPTVRADNYFLGDDFGLVHHLHNLPFARLLSYFYSDWTEGIYGFTLDELRPVLAFTYWLDAQMFGAINAAGYHATNVILHMFNGILVWAIARSVAPGQRALALLAGAIFVLMPSHAEPIAWISGRVDSVAAVFYLGGFLCFVRFRLRHKRAWFVATLLIFAGGLFAKQTLVTFPLIILAYDLVYGPGLAASTRREWISRYAAHVPFIVMVVGYLGIRHALFGNAVREDTITLQLLKEFALRQYVYLKSLVPVANASSYSVKVVGGVLMLAVLAACGSLLVSQRSVQRQALRHALFFGPIWYAVTIAPMLVAGYYSGRHLYVTAAGFGIAVASLLLPEESNSRILAKRTRVVVCVALVVLYGISLTRNIEPWVENGIESQRFTAALPPMLRPIPRGNVVLLGIPTASRQAWFWSWGLPFALQPPFVSEDLYAQYAFVERPSVYCCPQQWWSAKQAALAPLWNVPGPHEVTRIWPEKEGSLLMATVSGQAFKEKVEGAIGRKIQTLPSPLTDAEATRLAEILLDTPW